MRTQRAWITGGSLLALAGLPWALGSCGNSASSPAVDTSTPHVVGPSKEEIGKYIVQIAACHECHTPGILQGRDLKDVPEAQWLTGSPLGFSGPWGTSYASNLRLKAGPYDEALFIAAMRKRDARPPMPWAAFHAMTDADLGAVFAYIKALGPSGNPMPEPLPVAIKPQQPFIIMVPGLDASGTPPTPPK